MAADPSERTTYRQSKIRQRKTWPLTMRQRSGAVRGFSLIEMMIVVCIIALAAALAAPSIITIVRDQRAAKENMGMMNAFREARVRAIGRGTAMKVRFIANALPAATLQVFEAFSLPTAAFQVPNGQCRTTNWNTTAPLPGPGSTGAVSVWYDSSLEGGKPTSQWQLSWYKPTTTVWIPVTELSVCFSGNGKVLLNDYWNAFGAGVGTDATPVWVPAPEMEFQSRRLDAGAPIGLTRSFKLFGNGTVRVADCDPLLVGVPCR